MKRSTTILALATWTGAAFALAAVPSTDAAAHWAYQPVHRPSPPTLADASRVQVPLDAFVLHALAQKNLTLAPPAEKTALVKRAWFNLLGTPPSAEDVESFVADPDPQAFTRLVDRLLADPRFGERWARYWLDVARYADSKGYVFEEERRYAFSYTYRDWVVRAFNEDLPYDTFILAQLAADLSVGKEDPRQLAAMGFLTLGRRFLNNEADIIDDRLDVTFRGLQAVTLGCARCHDHKFDPIPTADYYSLYGVFASSEEPKEKPLLGEPVRTPEYLAFEADLKKHEQSLTDFHLGKKRSLFEEGLLQRYLQACTEGWTKPDNELAALAKERKLYPSVTLRWRRHLQKLGERHPVVGPFLALLEIPTDSFAEEEATLVQVLATTPVNPLVLDAIKEGAPQSMAEVAKIYAKLLAKHNLDEPMPDASAEAMRLVLKSPEGIEGVDPMGLARDYSVPERDAARKLRNAIEHFKATAANGPDRAMTMQERPQPVAPVIFTRGNRSLRGAEVPRQFLACLSGPDRRPFAQGSGRLELAKSIASPDNPLTARVFANRVWGWLVGQPLVDTPSDFGIRTPPPANPALLDHLAAALVENGWSVKKLIREIMLSATWQQASDRPPIETAGQADPAVIDPNNTLCWKMNRRRRDFESFRDSMLAVSGRLDPAMGGRPVNLENAEANRRTIYGFIDRQNLPGLFRAFDFASPDQHSPKRFQTTVPQQALFALNNPFVLAQARTLAAPPADSPSARLTQLTRRVLARDPDGEELRSGLGFVLAPPVAQTAGDWEYGFGGVNEMSGRLEFHPLPYFGQERWSGSDTLPDPALDWVLLTRGGGHPGADAAHAAVLRWRSPDAARIAIRGEIKRPDPTGDGIRLRLVSSLRGVLNTWDIPAGGTADAAIGPLDVAASETLDWVIDAKDGSSSDSFQFAPRLTDAATGRLMADASRDFVGPALDPWVAYAQSLLASNEFLFVD